MKRIIFELIKFRLNKNNFIQSSIQFKYTLIKFKLINRII